MRQLAWYAYLLLVLFPAVAAVAEKPKENATPSSQKRVPTERRSRSLRLRRTSRCAASIPAEAAAGYLDGVAVAWQREQKCFACHANFAYLLARPAVSSDVPALSPDTCRGGAYCGGEGLPADEPERSSQTVLVDGIRRTEFIPFVKWMGPVLPRNGIAVLTAVC